MTREEAINKAWVYLTSCLPIEDYEEVDEIIKAIEQPCEDAVSRQAVLKSLNCEISGSIESDTDLSKYQREFQEFGRMVINAQEKVIKDLPSVTPVACIAEFRFSKEDIRELADEKIKEIVVERKKGKWIIDDEEEGRIWHCHCPECKKDPQDYIAGTENWWLIQLPNYCPNCGLEMEVEE